MQYRSWYRSVCASIHTCYETQGYRDHDYCPVSIHCVLYHLLLWKYFITNSWYTYALSSSLCGHVMVSLICWALSLCDGQPDNYVELCGHVTVYRVTIAIPIGKTLFHFLGIVGSTMLTSKTLLCYNYNSCLCVCTYMIT